MRIPCSIAAGLLAVVSLTTRAATPPAGIESFNQKLEDATRRMDNTATLALWSEDGISLLPDTPPIVGKAAIATFLERVTAPLKSAHMETFEMTCSGIETSGDLATEWCTEHQVVTLPGGKPPFDGRGKMLLVLKKGSDGQWRLLREMWNRAGSE